MFNQMQDIYMLSIYFSWLKSSYFNSCIAETQYLSCYLHANMLAKGSFTNTIFIEFLVKIMFICL